MADYYAAFGSNGNYRLHVQAYESATYIASNESDVVVNAWVERTGGSGYFTGNGNATAGFVINGSAPGVGNWSPYDFTSYSSKLISSGTYRIAHNSDGTKTVNIQFSANDPNNFGYTDIGSQNLVLTTLPRASVPTLSAYSVDAGGTITINTNRLSSSFTHNIQYDFVALTGQTTGLAASTGVATSTTFTPPTSLLSQIPNAMSGTLVVRVTTFNGATQIGSPQTVNLTLNVPTSAVPTIGTLTVDEGTVSPDVKTLVGQYVQNVSKVFATIRTMPGNTVTTAAGVYGSSIQSSKITVDGQLIAGETGTTAAALTSSGTVTVTAEVTDSRGQKGTATQNITVLPYTPPVAPTVEARRALVSGAVDQSDGTYIRVDMSAVVQSLINGTQKNLLQYRISTSPAGANSWTVRVGPTSSGATTLAYDSYTTPFPYILLTAGAPYSITSSFDVKVEVMDKLNTSVYTRTVAQGKLLVDHNSNLGVAFGGYHSGGNYPAEIYGQGRQNGNDLLDSSMGATQAVVNTGTNNASFVTPATLSYTRRTGTVSSTWTGSASPTVTISGVGDVTAFVADPTDEEVQPGSQVVLELVEQQWYIVSSFATTTKYPRQLPFPMASGWISYDEANNTFPDNRNRLGRPRFTKSAAGWVVLAGLLQKNSAIAASEVIGTLPVGFRPAVDMIFPAATAAGTLGLSISASTGQVSIISGAQASGWWVSLANVRFNPSLTYTNMTLVPTWTHHTSAGPVPGYAKDAYGVVSLRGAVQGGAAGSNMWTPPAGFELASNVGAEHHQPTINSSTGGFTYFNNTTGGLSRPRLTSFHALNNLIYPATGHTLTFQNTNTFLNSWSHYGSGYPPLGVALRPDGLVQMKGLLYGGASGTQVFTLPEGMRPKTRLLFVVVAGEQTARIDVYPEGTVAFIFGNTAWLALDGLMFAAEQ